MIERVELELLRSLPSGVNDAYARSFFRRNRAWMPVRRKVALGRMSGR